jgi:prevent-host-death family protein
MKTYGAFEAKTHFSQLLAMVESSGEEILIRRRGKDVAVLMPFEKKQDTEREKNAKEVLEALKRIRESQTEYKVGKGMTNKEMVNYGRKR